MRIQDFLVRQTYRALEDICRAALAVPEERHDWGPEGARSALSQMQEIALAPKWFIPIIAHRGVAAAGDHADKARQATRRTFATIQECVEEARSGTNELCDAIASFPDDELDREVQLPFGPGLTVTMAEVLGLHYWNMTYHLGQINYIQTLLGDREMH